MTAGAAPRSGGASRPQRQKLPRSVVRFGHACLWASAALLATHVAHALFFYKSHALAAAMAALCAAAIAARFALSPASRVKAGLSLLSALLVVHAFELVLALRRPAPATAAARAGRPWDSRPMGDVLHDLRAADQDAWPSARPRQLLKERRRGLDVGGREALPFGGISGVTTILCNEGGTWAVYPADEHGFNNPPGLWTSGAGVDLALLGDSFTQGACVAPEENLAAVLRARHPATLNLGMLGNGPLIELGTLIEMLPAARPKRVLWLYFRNDLADLAWEKRSPLLRRYVDDESFRLGLADAQPAVDAALKDAISKLESEVAWWPRKLAAVGLTRQTSPVLLQDLAMNEHNASSTAALRLEHIVGLFAGGDPEGPSATPPDWPLFERVLAKAQRVVASWGGALTFVYLPDFWPPGAPGLEDHPSRAGVLAAVGRVGLPVVDVHAALRARRDQAPLLYYGQSHCTPAGYAALGEAILAGLDGTP